MPVFDNLTQPLCVHVFLFVYFLWPLQLKDEFVPELREQWEREERRRQREARWAAVPRRVSSRQASLQAAQEERDRLEAIKEAKLMEEREARAKAAAERVGVPC